MVDVGVHGLIEGLSGLSDKLLGLCVGHGFLMGGRVVLGDAERELGGLTVFVEEVGGDGDVVYGLEGVFGAGEMLADVVEVLLALTERVASIVFGEDYLL